MFSTYEIRTAHGCIYITTRLAVRKNAYEHTYLFVCLSAPSKSEDEDMAKLDILSTLV